MTSVIGAEVRLVVGDPFEIAGREYAGVIIDADSPLPHHVLVSLSAPVAFHGVDYLYLVLAARRGGRLSLSGAAEEVTGIALEASPHSSDGAWGADRWRGGGLGLQASLTCHRQNGEGTQAKQGLY